MATGLINNTWHCCIETSNYYIDLTAKQFNPGYPDLMIARKNKAKQESLFVPEKSYLVKDWLKYEESK